MSDFLNASYQFKTPEDKSIRILCSKCSGKTMHKIWASIEEYGSDDFRGSYWWRDIFQLVQCNGCQSVSFRIESTTSENMCYVEEEDDFIALIEEELYPPRFEGVKGLGHEAYILPDPVRKVYNETLRAVSTQLSILAGVGLRTLLEIICKDRKAAGKTLFEQIDSLVSQQILTPTSATILHSIRTLGNSAAHEAMPLDNRQMKFAFDIVEHLLKEVYIFPIQAESSLAKPFGV